MFKPNTIVSYQSLQSMRNELAEKKINKDINRSFPAESVYYKSEMMIRKLMNILLAYSNWDKDLGYIQGSWILIIIYCCPVGA